MITILYGMEVIQFSDLHDAHELITSKNYNNSPSIQVVIFTSPSPK